MASFNLIENAFVPCVHTDGRVQEYGLREVLLKAHEIAELRDPSPLVTIALHRLLLAILHRCYKGPRTTAARIAIRNAGEFEPDRITAYFGKWADRFDLFHEEYPFYQRANFKTAEPSGINRLAQELSRGNNAALFDHTIDNPPPAMTPAQAARLVIAEQAFAVGGGKSDTGNTTHAPLVSGAVVLVRGETLFETLWLNLTIYDAERPVISDDDDAPVWERPVVEPHKEPAIPYGYLDYLTWQTRTLRLLPEIENGIILVRRVYYSQGRRCEPDPGFFNPMVAFNRKETKDPWQPVRFNEYRDLWRDSAALYHIRDFEQRLERAPGIIHDLSADGLRKVLPAITRYNLSVFGLCTDKAKVNFWRHESLPLPLAYLEIPDLVAQLKRAILLAEEVASDALRKAVWVTAANRLTGDSGMNPDTDRVRDLVDSFAPERLYWSRLEPRYRDLILAFAQTPTDQETLCQGWFFDSLRPSAITAFQETIGRNDAARDLKAVNAGEGLLRHLLGRVQTANRISNRNQTKEGAA